MQLQPIPYQPKSLRCNLPTTEQETLQPSLSTHPIKPSRQPSLSHPANLPTTKPKHQPCLPTESIKTLQPSLLVRSLQPIYPIRKTVMDVNRPWHTRNVKVRSLDGHLLCGCSVSLYRRMSHTYWTYLLIDTRTKRGAFMHWNQLCSPIQ